MREVSRRSFVQAAAVGGATFPFTAASLLAQPPPALPEPKPAAVRAAILDEAKSVSSYQLTIAKAEPIIARYAAALKDAPDLHSEEIIRAADLIGPFVYSYKFRTGEGEERRETYATATILPVIERLIDGLDNGKLGVRPDGIHALQKSGVALRKAALQLSSYDNPTIDRLAAGLIGRKFIAVDATTTINQVDQCLQYGSGEQRTRFASELVQIEAVREKVEAVAQAEASRPAPVAGRFKALFSVEREFRSGLVHLEAANKGDVAYTNWLEDGILKAAIAAALPDTEIDGVKRRTLPRTSGQPSDQKRLAGVVVREVSKVASDRLDTHRSLPGELVEAVNTYCRASETDAVPSQTFGSALHGFLTVHNGSELLLGAFRDQFTYGAAEQLADGFGSSLLTAAVVMDLIARPESLQSDLRHFRGTLRNDFPGAIEDQLPTSLELTRDLVRVGLTGNPAQFARPDEKTIVGAHAISRLPEQGTLFTVNFLRGIFALVPDQPDKSLPEIASFPSKWKLPQLRFDEGEREAAQTVMVALGTLGEDILTELCRLDQPLSNEALLNRVITILKLAEDRYESVRLGTPFQKRIQQELGKALPIVSAPAPGPFSNMYHSVRNSLYTAKWGQLPQANLPSPDIDRAAMAYASSADKLFLCDLVLALWQFDPEERPLASHQTLAPIAMKREMLQLLRDLKVQDRYRDFYEKVDKSSSRLILRDLRGQRTEFESQHQVALRRIRSFD